MISLILSVKRDTSLKISTTTGPTLSDYAQAQHNLTHKPTMMQLNSDRRNDLIEAYAEQLVDGMDVKTLMQFAYDNICENLTEYSDSELIGDIYNYHGDDEAETQSFCEDYLTQEELNYFVAG